MKEEIFCRRVRRIKRQRIIKNIKIILKSIWLPVLIIIITLYFASCTSYEATLSSKGKVEEVSGNRVLVSFEEMSGNYDIGRAWFYMLDAQEGDKVILIRY